MRLIVASLVCLAWLTTLVGCPADAGEEDLPSGQDICSGNGCQDPGQNLQDSGVLPKDGFAPSDVPALPDGSKAPLGAPCEVNADCADALCHHPVDGEPFCSRECWGSCPDGFRCDPAGLGRVCVPDICEPDCTGKVCGSDGCDGTCGSCEVWEQCDEAGLCQPVPQPFGGPCTQSIHCESSICYAVGGDPVGFCSVLCSEGCPADHKCGDYVGVPVCVPGCEPSCDGMACGNDGCGGVCGKPCEFGHFCQSGSCDWLPCVMIPWVGCCRDEVHHSCQSGELLTTPCSDNPFCGWSAPQGHYTCGVTPEAEPTGDYPLDCPVTGGLSNLDCEGWFGCSELCEDESWCLEACDAATRPDELALAQSLWSCGKQNTCGFDHLCLQSHCPADTAACFVD